MKKSSTLFVIALALSAFDSAFAQGAESKYAITRPRIVAAIKNKQPAKASVTNRTARSQEPTAKTKTQEDNSSPKRLTPVRVRARIDEAKRMMKSRPMPTALTPPSLEYVTLAAFLPENSHIHLIRISQTDLS